MVARARMAKAGHGSCLMKTLQVDVVDIEVVIITYGELKILHPPPNEGEVRYA